MCVSVVAGVFETKSHSSPQGSNSASGSQLMDHTSEGADMPCLFYSVLFKGVRQVPNIK